MDTREDVAKAIGLPLSSLTYILYNQRERRHYRHFDIPRRSGESRRISAPPRNILWLQRKLYCILRSEYKVKPCVHGFVDDKSIVTNALSHIKRRTIANFDLQDFFPSIHFGRIRGVFRNPPFSFGEEAATVIAQICCQEEENGTLPQGGAMSPFLSNLVCRNLDNQLIAFARRYRLKYSRYADDITFSSSRDQLPEELIRDTSGRLEVGDEFRNIIHSNRFALNMRKLRLHKYIQRQEVTGLTVNQFPNVPRRFVREIESALWACEKHGTKAAQAQFKRHYHGPGISIENVLMGRIAYLGMVRGKENHLVRRLSRRFNRLFNTKLPVEPLGSTKPSALTNSIPKHGGWNVWIDKYQTVITLVSISIEGSTHCGTAFHVGEGMLATAGHNVEDRRGQPFDRLWISRQGTEIELDVLFSPTSMQRPTIDVAGIRAKSVSWAGRIPTQCRLPQIGEEICAIGYPTIPLRDACLVAHVGVVEALPVCYQTKIRFIQVSFQSGGGLSGGCLIDKAGFALGIVSENVFETTKDDVSQRPYAQVVPMEYFDDFKRNFHAVNR